MGPFRGREGKAGRGEARRRRTARARWMCQGGEGGQAAPWRQSERCRACSRVMGAWARCRVGEGGAGARARGALGVPVRGRADTAGAQRYDGRACCAQKKVRPRGLRAADGRGGEWELLAPSRARRRARGGEVGPLPCAWGACGWSVRACVRADRRRELMERCAAGLGVRRGGPGHGREQGAGRREARARRCINSIRRGAGRGAREACVRGGSAERINGALRGRARRLARWAWAWPRVRRRKEGGARACSRFLSAQM